MVYVSSASLFDEQNSLSLCLEARRRKNLTVNGLPLNFQNCGIKKHCFCENIQKIFRRRRFRPRAPILSSKLCLKHTICIIFAWLQLFFYKVLLDRKCLSFCNRNLVLKARISGKLFVVRNMLTTDISHFWKNFATIKFVRTPINFCLVTPLGWFDSRPSILESCLLSLNCSDVYIDLAMGLLGANLPFRHPCVDGVWKPFVTFTCTSLHKAIVQSSVLMNSFYLQRSAITRPQHAG